jgi:hypothetical protein
LVAVALLAGFNAAVVTGDWVIPAVLGALFVVVAGAVALGRALSPPPPARDAAAHPRAETPEAPETPGELDAPDLPLDPPGRGELEGRRLPLDPPGRGELEDRRLPLEPPGGGELEQRADPAPEARPLR